MITAEFGLTQPQIGQNARLPSLSGCLVRSPSYWLWIARNSCHSTGNYCELWSIRRGALVNSLPSSGQFIAEL